MVHKKVIKPKKNSKPNLLSRFLLPFKHLWPILTLTSISLTLCYLNYDSGTFLTGWDNLHPEFNIKLDLQRTFFSVWQEYRGTGLLAGMAHSADLPRLLIIFLLSLLQTPTNLIRYITTFLPLIFGPVGVYILIEKILSDSKQTSKVIKTGAFLAGLYYIFNLSTLQTFFIPFETFTWFYGSLPFLIYFLIQYLKKPSVAHFLLVLFASFFSGTAFYVETIFVVLFLCLLPFVIELLSLSKNKLKSFTDSFLATTAIAIPNLYWLIPIAFFAKTNASFASLNRINLLSSPETYYRNLEYGKLKDIFLLKSYLFEYLDLGGNNKYDYLMSVWRNHFSSNLTNIIGYTIFLVIIIGIYFSIKEKIVWSKSFLGVLLISFFFLLGGGLLINNTLPFVGELFRSPFTKFSIPLSLAYSYFFAIGVIFLLDIFSFLDTKLTYNLTLFSVVIALVIYMSPAFSGNFISKSMRVAIPDQYFELFNYMNTQPKEARIANFPQHTFWGWNYYSWGYRGSGFIWYGLKQPVLDRAFDVWEKTSQDYYEELSTALYSENKIAFDQVIDKYAVTYLLVDKSIIAPDTKADLGLNYLENLLQDNPKYELIKTFGDNLFLYKNISQKSSNFLSLSSENRDLKSEILTFSLRPNQDWYQKAGFLNTTLTIPPATISLPSLSETEKLLPYKAEYRKSPSNLFIRFTPITPTFFVNQKQIDLDTKPQTIQIPIGSTKKFIISLNSTYFPFELPAEVDDFQNYYPITQTYLPTNKPFNFSLYSGIPTEQLPLVNSFSNASPTQCYTNKPERPIEKILTPRSITLLGTDVVACISTKLPTTNPGQLLAVSFTYYSPTLTTANVNLTDENFGATNTSQPFDPSNTPKRAQIFTNSSDKNKQINLILEASETKTIQEITYKDVFLSTHDSLFESEVSLNKIPEKKLTLDEKENSLQISLPDTKTQFDIGQISQSNALFPENRNCDQFNKGETVKQVNSDHILYQSRDAIECDFLNLRHFNHSLNYLIGIDAKKNRGLSLTTCLENHSTRRCDVYERLTDTKSTQYLLQPITNPQESPGYTLHLFNQSLGSRITENRLNSITIRPFPLTFLQNITTTNNEEKVDDKKESPIIFSSSHPSEFLYTASLKCSDNCPSTTLNLFQTYSPYWIAYVVPPEYLLLNSWQLSWKMALNYRTLPSLVNTQSTWHNTWNLPENPKDFHLVIVYLPQYLQFIGFATLLGFTTILLVFALHKQLRHKK